MTDNAENYERVKSLIASLKEMDSYKEKVEGSKVDCEEEQITVLQPSEPCSREISMIYTFNYQELPSIPKRQDSIFIPMPPKHGIFFVRCEGNAGQVNFLIDEAYQTTNGSNAVISCLHRFFENYGLGETRVDLYCNNGSNNKNNCLLWYLAYNVAKKLHVSIELHFLPKEHSKPILDEYFADIKQATKKTKGSIADLNSSIGESEDSNQSHIIDGRNDQMLDWQEHFRHDCRELPKIRSMQHFRFNFENPGVVFYSENVDNGEGEFRLFNQDSPVLTKKVPAIPLPDKHIDRKLWRYEGEFTVLEKLGEEDQDVYSVEHNLDRGRYALKKVSLTKNAVPDEVLKEAKNLAKLEHVNVVRYHTAWLDNEAESEFPDAKLSPKLYIQMELCSETLYHMLKRRNEDLVSVSQKERYDQVEKDADSILEQFLQGIKYIHSKNIVHGDLKSLNIFIKKTKDDDDKTEITVKIGDFGLTGSLDKNTQREAHPDGAKNDKVFVKHDDMKDVGFRAFELYHPIQGEENITTTLRDLVETHFEKFPDFPKKWPKLAKWISRLVSDGSEGRLLPSEILDDLFPSKDKIIATLEEEIREKDERILVLQKKLSEQKIQ